GQALGVEDVLGRERAAVQRSEDTLPFVVPVRVPRLLDGALAGGEDDGVQARVDGVDVLEVRAHDLNRGQLLGPDRACQPPRPGPDDVSHAGQVSRSGPSWSDLSEPIRSIR